MFLAPSGRPAAFRELARVVKPGGYLVTAFKAGDSKVRRAGRSTNLGVEFDVYWLAPDEIERRVTDAGFATVFRAAASRRSRRAPRKDICLPRGPEFLRACEHPLIKHVSESRLAAVAATQ
jgi:hypothetical protein